MLYKDLSGEILESALEVYHNLGYGFLEKVYERALIHELELRGLSFKNQKSLKIKYKGKVIGNYVADIVVEDKIIIELKSGNLNMEQTISQVLNYLKATGLHLGLIINFGENQLDFKRVILGYPDEE